jgi:hypothetical protein
MLPPRATRSYAPPITDLLDDVHSMPTTGHRSPVSLDFLLPRFAAAELYGR